MKNNLNVFCEMYEEIKKLEEVRDHNQSIINMLKEYENLIDKTNITDEDKIIIISESLKKFFSEV